MRALKVLIVIMGILLILGFTILAVMIFRKFQGFEGIHAEEPQSIPLPAGYSVVSIQDIGEKAVIHLRSSDNKDEILIINPTSGQEITRLRMIPSYNRSQSSDS